jgi:hypothetical protein
VGEKMHLELPDVQSRTHPLFGRSWLRRSLSSGRSWLRRGLLVIGKKDLSGIVADGRQGVDLVDRKQASIAARPE